MSSFLQSTPDGYKSLRLRDAIGKTPVQNGRSVETRQKELPFVMAGEEESTIASARRIMRSLRAEYQDSVIVTDRGTPACISCCRDIERADRKKDDYPSIETSTNQASPIKSYPYTTLQGKESIRILELQPAETYETPLQGSLIVYPNRKFAKYAALSYTWTGVEREGTLDLGWASMTISGNLDLALRALRKQKEVLCIWVDAICINQGDNQEKGVQVAQMSNVYTQAESVLAWLGPETELDEVALGYMKEVASLSENERYDRHIRRNPAPYDGPGFPISRDDAHQIQTMRKNIGLDCVFARLWFSRLWVVQEVILAKNLDLHIGQHSISWEMFRRATKMLWVADCQSVAVVGTKHLDPGPIYHALYFIDMRDKLHAFNAGTMLYRDYTTQLYGTVRDLRRWGCKDERDRVYAILGFIPDESNMTVTPDYNADSSHVYIDFARQHILREGLGVLLFAGLEQRPGSGNLELMEAIAEVPPEEIDSVFDRADFLESPDLPSWVPEPRPDRNHVLHRMWLPLTFNAALNRKPAVILHEECPHVIAVKGCVFDRITQPLPVEAVHPEQRGLMDYTQALRYVGFVWRFTKDFYSERGGYPTGESHKSAFESVVTVEKTTSKLKNLADSKHPGWIDLMLDILERGSDSGSGQVLEDAVNQGLAQPADFPMFLSCLAVLLDDYHCILTEEEFMGLAPKCSKGGDVIAWINELNSPVILRQYMDIGGQYQLVGPCFLQGVMHGELDRRGDDEDVCTFLELV
jgi:hypothetical protein